jgi:hypothetical protein
MTDELLEFARPPVRQSTVVRSGRGHTFAVFTDRIADWWPLDHSRTVAAGASPA